VIDKATYEPAIGDRVSVHDFVYVIEDVIGGNLFFELLRAGKHYDRDTRRVEMFRTFARKYATKIERKEPTA
jgi:hypothetical protein